MPVTMLTATVFPPRRETQILPPIILDTALVPKTFVDQHQQQHHEEISSNSNSNSNSSNKRRRVIEIGRCTKQLKKVRFNQVNHFDDLPVDYCPKELTWFSKTELEVFRCRSKSLALEISNNTHMKESPFSYRNVFESTYKQALLAGEEGKETPPEQDEVLPMNKGLWVWIQHGHSRRGLERWSVPSVGMHRQQRRSALVHTLMIVQQQQSLQDKDTVLQQLSEHYSQPSKVMSRALGAADAHAAKEASTTTERDSPTTQQQHQQGETTGLR